LKDRPQEVKKALPLPRESLSAFERHLCPQGIHKKGYKTNPHPDPRDHWFPGPFMSHYAVFLYK
jgi:hypothetical protein